MMVLRAFFSGLLVAVLTVSVVRGGRPPTSDIEAHCFSVVRCDSHREIAFQTGADCYLGNGLSYNIPRTEECINCVVYGWLNADSNGTIRVREDGAGQRFEVGFIKRGVAPPPPITLTISDVEGTARRGAANDYTLSNTMLSISSVSGDAATVTIRVDGVALEEDETFQLVLTATPQPIGYFFCFDVLNVIIEDVYSNVVDIQLTEDDYRASEADSNIRVVVSKNVIIATDVSLMITPVTVSEARERNLFPAGVVPPDDLQGRSLVNADLNDFDNSVLHFTFRADENEPAPTNEIEVLVSIAEDAINEDCEEIFVVILNLTDSVDPSGVLISRVSSLCRIIDNTSDRLTKPSASGINSAVLAALAICILVLLTLTIVLTVVACFGFKKKDSRKTDLQEQVYDSIESPRLSTFTALSKHIRQLGHEDEPKTPPDSASTQFKLTHNEAYSTCNLPEARAAYN